MISPRSVPSSSARRPSASASGAPLVPSLTSSLRLGTPRNPQSKGESAALVQNAARLTLASAMGAFVAALQRARRQTMMDTTTACLSDGARFAISWCFAVHSFRGEDRDIGTFLSISDGCDESALLLAVVHATLEFLAADCAPPRSGFDEAWSGWVQSSLVTPMADTRAPPTPPPLPPPRMFLTPHHVSSSGPSSDAAVGVGFGADDGVMVSRMAEGLGSLMALNWASRYRVQETESTPSEDATRRQATMRAVESAPMESIEWLLCGLAPSLAPALHETMLLSMERELLRIALTPTLMTHMTSPAVGDGVVVPVGERRVWDALAWLVALRGAYATPGRHSSRREELTSCTIAWSYALLTAAPRDAQRVCLSIRALQSDVLSEIRTRSGCRGESEDLGAAKSDRSLSLRICGTLCEALDGAFRDDTQMIDGAHMCQVIAHWAVAVSRMHRTTLSEVIHSSVFGFACAAAVNRMLQQHVDRITDAQSCVANVVVVRALTASQPHQQHIVESEAIVAVSERVLRHFITRLLTHDCATSAADLEGTCHSLMESSARRLLTAAAAGQGPAAYACTTLDGSTVHVSRAAVLASEAYLLATVVSVCRGLSRSSKTAVPWHVVNLWQRTLGELQHLMTVQDDTAAASNPPHGSVLLFPKHLAPSSLAALALALPQSTAAPRLLESMSSALPLSSLSPYLRAVRRLTVVNPHLLRCYGDDFGSLAAAAACAMKAGQERTGAPRLLHWPNVLYAEGCVTANVVVDSCAEMTVSVPQLTVLEHMLPSSGRAKTFCGEATSVVASITSATTNAAGDGGDTSDDMFQAVTRSLWRGLCLQLTAKGFKSASASPSRDDTHHNPDWLIWDIRSVRLASLETPVGQLVTNASTSHNSTKVGPRALIRAEAFIARRSKAVHPKSVHCSRRASNGNGEGHDAEHAAFVAMYVEYVQTQYQRHADGTPPASGDDALLSALANRHHRNAPSDDVSVRVAAERELATAAQSLVDKGFLAPISVESGVSAFVYVPPS